jgi:hypothetical protein
MDEFVGDYYLKINNLTKDVKKSNYRVIEKGGAEKYMGFSKNIKSDEIINLFNDGIKDRGILII